MLFPGALGQLALGVKLGELRFVVRVGDGAGPKPVAGGEVHHGVSAPFGGPTHFFDFFFDGGSDGAVPDVGVDLYEEIAADDHRLGFGMIDVGRDDGAATRYFTANKLGSDFGWDRSA